MPNDVAERITAAIAATKRLVPGYFQATCESRGGENPCGSVILLNDKPAFNVEHLLFSDYLSMWTEYDDCPNLMPGCKAYKLWKPGIGRLGVVELGSLEDDSVVTLDDRKNTGKVSATVKGALGKVVDFVVCIIGQEQGEDVIFTFHPGDPVNPSQVQAEPGLHGKTVTVSQARQMGLETAKIV